MGPELLLIGLGAGGALGGAMGGLTAAGASAQNKAIEKAQRDTAAAAKVEMQQVNEQAAMERQKRIADAQVMESRLRVAAGESGIGITEMNLSLQRQNDVNAAIDTAILNRNLMNNMLRIRSEAKARISQLESSKRNAAIEGTIAGIQGFASGLAITASAGSLAGMTPPAPVAPLPA